MKTRYSYGGDEHIFVERYHPQSPPVTAPPDHLTSPV